MGARASVYASACILLYFSQATFSVKCKRVLVLEQAYFEEWPWPIFACLFQGLGETLYNPNGFSWGMLWLFSFMN